jgi:hypothetical protein
VEPNQSVSIGCEEQELRTGTSLRGDWQERQCFRSEAEPPPNRNPLQADGSVGDPPLARGVLELGDRLEAPGNAEIHANEGRRVRILALVSNELEESQPAFERPRIRDICVRRPVRWEGEGLRRLDDDGEERSGGRCLFHANTPPLMRRPTTPAATITNGS